MNNSEAWILVNVGTPENPSASAVRKYLRDFLGDPMVIDLPRLPRKILVNLIIAPFRAPRSAAKYSSIWTDKGSPLLIHLENLVAKMDKITGEGIDVFGAMRYGEPSLKKLLLSGRLNKYAAIRVLPLYPQYAESTTGTVKKLVDSIPQVPEFSGRIEVVEDFYTHPGFIKAMARRIIESDPGSFDHILFSYHGLPDRHVKRSHPDREIVGCICESQDITLESSCYKADCYATTRLIAKKAELSKERFSTSFQSRLTSGWIKPFTDQKLKELAQSGKKKVLVVPASFTADCLETTFEIAEEYAELFRAAGGTELRMTESLNASDEWANAVIEIITEIAK